MKIIRILQFKILLLFPVIVFSQSYYFNNKYSSNSGFWCGLNSIIEVENGYLVGGATDIPPPNSWHQITITLLDIGGNKKYENFFGDTISEYYIASNSLIRSTNTHLYFTGTRRTYPQKFAHDEILLVKLDSEYDSVWTKLFGEKDLTYDSAYIARNLIELSNGEFMIVGTMTPEINYKDNVVLVKTDQEGNKLSEWLYNYVQSDWKLRGFSVIETPDKGFAIGAYRFKPGYNYTGEPMVYKVDSLGNEEWHINIGNILYFDHLTMLCNAHDGNIIAATCYADSMQGSEDAYRRMNVLKIDLDGNVIWNKKYGSSKSRNYVGNIRPVPGGGYIVTGSVITAYQGYPYGWLSGWLLKIDDEGDSLWHRTYDNLGYDSHNYLYDVITTSDNGFAACGETFGPSNGYLQQGWVIKVDSMGCDTPGCATGTFIRELSPSGGGQGEVKVWPNPCRDKFYVTPLCPPSRGEIRGVKIFNSQGTKVDEVKVPEGMETITFQTEYWPRGIYFLVLECSGLVTGNAKIIVR